MRTLSQAFSAALMSVCLSWSYAPKVSAESVRSPTIAIIIDDMGHHYRNGADLAEMPYPLTLAFLPKRRYTKELASLAYEYGKEIMLHVPMENTLGIALGQGALTSTMPEQAVKASLAESLRSIPYVMGVNNHMGSLLTTRPKTMIWVMEHLKSTPYYFVDSRTSASSVAAKAARDQGVPNMSRDIFLDHEQTSSYVRSQFSKLIDVAQRKGTAIAIGHPHKVTIDFLRHALPKLDQMGISIATASGIWQLKNPYAQLPYNPALSRSEHLAANLPEQPGSTN